MFSLKHLKVHQHSFLLNMKSIEIGDIFKGDEAGVNGTMPLFKKEHSIFPPENPVGRQVFFKFCIRHSA